MDEKEMGIGEKILDRKIGLKSFSLKIYWKNFSHPFHSWEEYVNQLIVHEPICYVIRYLVRCVSKHKNLHYTLHCVFARIRFTCVEKAYDKPYGQKGNL